MKSLKLPIHQAAHGSVSKLVDNSYAVSFAPSGRDPDSFCWLGCRLIDVCYAQRQEAYRKNSVGVAMKRRRAAGAREVLRSAALGMPRSFVWLRLFVNGSAPMREDFDTAAEWRAWRREFREFVEMGLESGADVHLPLESPRKVRAYRSILQGLPVVVRQSLQVDSPASIVRAAGQVSWVVVAPQNRLHRGGVKRTEREANHEHAVKVAAWLRSQGLSVVVCPFDRSGRQCGSCRACASARVDVVLYPFHG